MSVYRVEVQLGRDVWSVDRVCEAFDELRAMRRVLRDSPEGITAIRAMREYPVESSVPLDRRRAGQRLG